MKARPYQASRTRRGPDRQRRVRLLWYVGLAVWAGWLLPLPLARAQPVTPCQVLAARFAAAPDRLDPQALAGLASCVTAELAARMAPPGAVQPEGAPAPEAEQPLPTTAPAPQAVPPNVFPAQRAPSPSIAAPAFPDQAAGPAPTFAPQQYLGQWPPTARWSTWPAGGW